MAELIYSKFSNERDRRFAIRTDIYEEEGKRFVKKAAVYPEGEQHIKNLFRWYQELSKLYEGCSFSCNICEPAEDGMFFEYIHGETLEESLDFMLAQGNEKEAEVCLTEYFENVKTALSIETFVQTEAFAEVFGNVTFEEEFMSAPVTNIDMVCGNLILSETPVVVDYEWTFDFPIPVSFVLYRILHYYEKTHRQDDVFWMSSLYEKFGISKELQNLFQEMEKHFQNYMKGNHVPTREMFGSMTPGLTDKRKDETGNLQVYFSYGEGYCEENSMKLPIKNNLACHTIDIPEGCVDIRIDPGDTACAVNVRNLAFDEKKVVLEQLAIADGRVSGEWIYIGKSDPNITGLTVLEGAKKLEINLEIYPQNALVLQSMIQKIDEMNLKLHKLEKLKNSLLGKTIRVCTKLAKKKSTE